MKKKAAFLAIAITVVIILGGLNSNLLFGTQRIENKALYNYAVTSGEDWWNTSWAYCKKIIINHSLVTTDLLDFPILVRIDSDSDLSSNAQSDGGDIVFVDEYNSTVYSHEIETYNNSTGALNAWVKISSVSSTQDTVFYMYYGNSTVADQETPNNVWSSNFRMVHHLHENLATVTDSTSYYNNGTVNSATYNSSTSIVNGGYDFTGSQNISCGNDNSLDLTNSITLEGWVKDPPLFNKHDNSVRIVNKKDEKLFVIPDRSFSVSRTISTDKKNSVVFAALFSPDIKLDEMTVNGDNVFEKIYLAGQPQSKTEKKIEKLYDELPEKLRNLPIVGYSKPIQLDADETVEMIFETGSEIELFNKKDSRISYLLLSLDGSYDFECTTHLQPCLSVPSWFNPFSVFKFIKEIIEERSSVDLPEIVEDRLLNEETVRVIIKLKDDGSYDSVASQLSSSGFKIDAEVSSERLFAGTLDQAVYDKIKLNDDIVAIYDDLMFAALLNESLPRVRFDEAFEDFGLTGAGKKICILDTGVDSSLVDYSYGYDFVNDDTVPEDGHGHGTSVADIIHNIVPDAELIVAKVIDSNGLGYESDVLEGLQWCIDQNPDIISFSIGTAGGCSGFCDNNFVVDMCHDAVDMGIFVVAASGNDGSQSLKAPACGSKVFSVGSTDDEDNIAGFSNVNPTLDMFAPGVDIETVLGSSSGTSMSAPHVAGAVALLLEKESLTPGEVSYRLRSTGKPVEYVYNDSLTIDIPRLDIYNALSNNKTMEPYNYSNWWQDELEGGEYYEALGFMSYGTPNVPTSSAVWDTVVAEVDTNVFVIAAMAPTGGFAARVGTVSGTSITWGTSTTTIDSDVYVTGTADTNRVDICKIDTNKVAVVYTDDSLSDDGYTRVGTVSGTGSSAAVSFGTAKEFETTDMESPSCAQLDTDKYVICYNDEGDPGIDVGKAVVCTVSGTTVTAGTPTDFAVTDYYPKWTSVDSASSSNFFVAFEGEDADDGYVVEGTVSGTTITFNTVATFTTNNPNNIAIAMSSSSSYGVIAYYDTTLSRGYVIPFRDLGTTISCGTAVTVDISGLGACRDGIDVTHYSGYTFLVTYDLNSGYSVRAVLSAGSPPSVTIDNKEEFETGSIGGITDNGLDAVFIDTKKAVIVYQDDDNSDYGTAVIGDVSPVPSVTIDNIPDQTESVINITGSASDDGTIDNVLIGIENQTLGKYWNGAIWTNIGTSKPSLVCSASDGAFDEANEDWYYDTLPTFVEGNVYRITAAAYDDIGQKSDYKYEYFNISSNNAPVISGEIPANQSTGISTQPACNVTVNDADEDLMDVHFWDNSSGTWTKQQSNLSVQGPDVCYWDYTGASSAGTKYWWNVTAYDMRNESPSEYWDEYDVWFDEEYAYDGDTGTYAYTDKNAPGYFNLSSAENCSKIWIYAAFFVKVAEQDIEDVDIAAYYDGAYRRIYRGSLKKNIWTPLPIHEDYEIEEIQSIRILNNGKGTLRIKELNFTKSAPTTETYYFTTPLNTSVDTIIPYEQTSSPLSITATNSTAVDNITLWYRYSTDNSSWGGSGSGEATYHFDHYDSGGEEWAKDPAYMADGDDDLYAVTDTDGDVELLDENNYTGGEMSDTINWVHLRFNAFDEKADMDIILRPVFSGGDGDNHSVDVLELTPAWYIIDITNDTNSPDTWLWEHIAALDCDVECKGSGGVLDCSIVQIIVGYTGAEGWIENDTDSSSPYSWSFSFPNSTGYYEFYSIGKKSGSTDEPAPGSADAICNYTASVDDPPYATNVSISSDYDFTLDDLTGSYDYNDNESDAESGTSYEWYTNESGSWAALGVNSTTLDSNYTNESSWYKFEITPRNANGTGSPANSSAVHIVQFDQNLVFPATYSGAYDEGGNITVVDTGSGNIGITGTLNLEGDFIIAKDATVSFGSNDHTLGSLYVEGSCTGSSGTMHITNEAYDGYAFRLSGSYANNSGTIEIQTTDPTGIDLYGSTGGEVYNLIINAGSTVYWRPLGGVDTTISNDLTVTAGTFQPFSASQPLTAAGDVTVNGGTLGGNSASGTWTFGSLYMSSGTIDATANTIIVNGNTNMGIGLDGGTFTNNSGTVEINSDCDGVKNTFAQTGDLYNLVIDLPVTSYNSFLMSACSLGGNLDIDDGVFDTTGYPVNVIGEVLIQNGGEFNATGDNVHHYFGALDLDSGGTIQCPSGRIIYITNESGGYAVDLDGTFTNNSGILQINTPSATEADLTPTTGEVYDLKINAGSTVDWDGPTTINDDLTVTTGAFRPKSEGDTLTVIDNVTVNGGTLGGNSANELWMFGSLYLSSGTIDATSYKIGITGESNNYAVNLDGGTYTNNSGQIQIMTNADTNIDIEPSNGEVYVITIDLGSSSYDAILQESCHIGNYLGITEGELDTNNKQVRVNGLLRIWDGGEFDTTGDTVDHNFGALDIDSGGIFTGSADSQINITSESSGYAVDLDGTYNANSNTIEINTGANTDIDIAGTGNLYKLIIDTNDCTVTNNEDATVDDNITIETGTLDITANLTVKDMQIDSAAEFGTQSGSNFTMQNDGILTLNGYFNITSGNATNVNLSRTKFNLTSGINVSLHSIPTTPSDPLGYDNISKYVNLTSIGASSTVDINITYSDSDLGSVVESTLSMWEYNETTQTWTEASTTGVNTVTNNVWANGVTDFSIYGPLGQGPNTAPTQSGENPTNTSTNICPIPSLHVICTDNDDDTMNATWWSNSSGSWVQFASNTSVSNNTNITQTNSNFSQMGTIYWWSVNLTDRTDWNNETYHFTTNYAPTQTGEVPANGSTSINTTPSLYVICSDADSDTMTATWQSNSSGTWQTFATNTSINSGTNITQTNSNFSQPETTYYWSVNLTDGCTWTNTTYHFTTQTTKNPPTVTTNASTGVEETNATLRGYLNNDGGENCTLGFRFGTKSGTYTENFSLAGTYPTGTEFDNNNGSLTPGQIYFYQAWANNTAGFANGTELTFLTKPNPASNLNAQTNSSTIIYITWTKGTGANNTYIERNSIDNWARGDGTLVYNGSDTKFENTSLSPGTTYYYQAWSYAEWTYNPTIHQWSDLNISDSNTTKNVPQLSNENPTNQSTDISLNPTLSIQVNHSDSYLMDITWYWGTSSNCPNNIGNNASVSNGTYYMTNDNNFSSYSTTYYWKICVNDGHGEWTNETYHFTTIGENKVVIGKGQNTYSMEISNDSSTLYGFINGNSVTTTIDTNWHYVTMTYDGTDLKIYKDGIIQNTTNIGGNINTNTQNVTIGEKLTGTLDELRISSTARTPGWVNTTYNTIKHWDQFITVYNQRTQSPTITNPNPSNGATGVSLQPTCNVTVSDPDSGTVAVYFYENTTGSWILQQINSSIDVTTPANIIWNNYSNASNPLTKYWWSVRVTDGYTWTNKTYYFSTKA